MAKYRPLVRKKHVYKFNTTKRNEQDRQSERMYSEEEVLDILDKLLTSMVKGEKTGLMEHWFEQFKKTQ